MKVCIDCTQGMCPKAESLSTEAWKTLEVHGPESKEYEVAQAALEAHLDGSDEPEPIPTPPPEENVAPEVMEEPEEPVIQMDEEPPEATADEEEADIELPNPFETDPMTPVETDEEPPEAVADEEERVPPPTQPATMPMPQAQAAKGVKGVTLGLEKFSEYPVPDLFSGEETDKKYRYKMVDGQKVLVGIFGKDATLLPNEAVDAGVEKWRTHTPDLSDFKSPHYTSGSFQYIRYLSYKPVGKSFSGLDAHVGAVVKNSEDCTLGYSVTGMLLFKDAAGKEVFAVPCNSFAVFKRKHTKNFNPEPEEAAEMTRSLLAAAHDVGPNLEPLVNEVTGDAVGAQVLEDIITSKVISFVHLPEYLAQFKKMRRVNTDPLEWSKYRCANDAAWRASHDIPDKLLQVYIDIQRNIWTSEGMREDNRLNLLEKVNDVFASVGTFRALLS